MSDSDGIIGMRRGVNGGEGTRSSERRAGVLCAVWLDDAVSLLFLRWADVLDFVERPPEDLGAFLCRGRLCVDSVSISLP